VPPPGAAAWQLSSAAAPRPASSQHPQHKRYTQVLSKATPTVVIALNHTHHGQVLLGQLQDDAHAGVVLVCKVQPHHIAQQGAAPLPGAAAQVLHIEGGPGQQQYKLLMPRGNDCLFNSAHGAACSLRPCWHVQPVAGQRGDCRRRRSPATAAGCRLLASPFSSSVVCFSIASAARVMRLLHWVRGARTASSRQKNQDHTLQLCRADRQGGWQ
jgi:hypothetical protein